MEANHDYLMAVKENQPSLYKAIEKRALSEPACSEITVQDNSHGRQVSRKVRVYEASAGLQQKWRGWQSFVVVERQGKREGKNFEEKAYFISSERLSVEAFLKAIQGHWSIENQFHWVKDVALKEDNPSRRAVILPLTGRFYLVGWLPWFAVAGFGRFPKLGVYGLTKLTQFLLYFYETTLPTPLNPPLIRGEPTIFNTYPLI